MIAIKSRFRHLFMFMHAHELRFSCLHAVSSCGRCEFAGKTAVLADCGFFSLPSGNRLVRFLEFQWN